MQGDAWYDRPRKGIGEYGWKSSCHRNMQGAKQIMEDSSISCQQMLSDNTVNVISSLV